jgi:putative hemolysin
VLNGAAAFFVRLFVQDQAGRHQDSSTIDEHIFKSMVEAGSRDGTIQPDERDLIHRAFHLDDINVAQIMVPRDRMVAAPTTISEQALLHLIETEKYSRYPVYEGDIDHIIGFMHVKDLLRLKSAGADIRPVARHSILRKATFIAVTRNALSVLLQFQKSKTHIGVVLDGQGKTAGIVTLEDILEELFGEIKDETDMEDNPHA